MSDKFDSVEKPKHYNLGKVECIDALEAATVGLTGIEAVCTANAVKYLWRWKQKNGLEDLRKARWYIDHLLGEHEKSRNFKPVVAKCVKCLRTEQLNSEGMCVECFSEPSKASQPATAQRVTCNAFWNKTVGRPGYVCQLAYGHAGDHQCIDGEDISMWAQS